MAEATFDADQAAEIAALKDAARQFERARLKQFGAYHFAMVIGALTLWGAAQTWALVTHWSIAEFAAIGGALVAGFVIPSTLHEWGHFAGARLSGAKSPVLDQVKRHYFMFDFPIEENDTRQFSWMSWGGILAPWIVVLLAAIFVPLSLTSGAVLFATLISRAVAVSAFEFPIVQAVGDGADPNAELTQRVKGGSLDRAGKLGNAVGIGCFALVWLLF